MKTRFRVLMGLLVAISGVTAAVGAHAQSRSAIIEAPAKIAVKAEVRQPADPVATPVPSVVVVVPGPLPPVPPNACNRGNSSGVSRC